MVSFLLQNLKRNYQIHLKSNSGPINVLLVNKESELSAPVAVSVPPPPADGAVSSGGEAGSALPNNPPPSKKLTLDSSPTPLTSQVCKFISVFSLRFHSSNNARPRLDVVRTGTG